MKPAKESPSPPPAQKEQDKRPMWVALAIFGDSTWALGASFLLLVASIAVSWSLQVVAEVDPYTQLGPIPDMGPPTIYNSAILTPELRTAYETEGVIAVRGLIDNDLLDALDRDGQALVQQQESASKRPGAQFHTVRHGVVFLNETTSFRRVALESPILEWAAQLLNVPSVRLLRDIFLAKDSDPYICGWHVDDLGFWPTVDDGVNAWIALDDVYLDGGFALALYSHTADYRDEAHWITGAATTVPKEGYANVSDLFRRRTGSGTCNLQHSAPHLHRRMEETKRVYDIRRGDVIFHDRWLFHRTVAFADRNETKIAKRYSLRYNAGSAVIPPGYGTEPSVLWDPSNGGHTADWIVEKDGPWYPTKGDDVGSMAEKIALAEQRVAARHREMRPYLQRMAREQNRAVIHGAAT